MGRPQPRRKESNGTSFYQEEKKQIVHPFTRTESNGTSFYQEEKNQMVQYAYRRVNALSTELNCALIETSAHGRKFKMTLFTVTCK